MYKDLTNSLNSLLSKVEKRIEKLDETYEEVGKNIVNISHDLRTPLTSARGYIQLAMGSKDNDEKYDMIKIANERLSVLSELLEQLFIYTKINDERFKLNPEELNLTDLVIEYFAEHYCDFEERNIDIEMNVDDDITIFQDRKAIINILDNAVQNILRYGKNILKVCIKNREEAVEIVLENETDQEFEDIEKLKESYVTGKGFRPEGSTGLGLSIIGKHIEKMGGKYYLQYEKGKFSLIMLIK